VSEEASVANLEKVDHLVVLMLENRSFDHMLGYLSLTGGRDDIDGLRREFANVHLGRSYPIHRLDATNIAIDPDHSSSAIDVQLGEGRMDGFVASLAATLSDRELPDTDAGLAMGYFDAADVPVHDHLAAEFLVCDRWFSSVPGSTWPNRLYSLCGRADGSRDDRPPHVPPMYDQPSFVRHLDAHRVSWRWYSFDPATLRMADAHYSLGHHDKIAYFSKEGLPWKSKVEVRTSSRAASFLEDAARGTLPSVAWIDPNFSNFNELGVPPNDDHAPADITDGQELVLAVYDALARSPQWERSLLVVVYDEHGGFFDHVPPPEAQDEDPKMFGRYGVRVPAIIVSPWVERRSVSKTVFDHTSIIKTILLRFCAGALHDQQSRHRPLAGLSGAEPRSPGTRVLHANHLGELLSATAPRPAPSHQTLIDAAAARASEPAPADAAETDGQAPTDLQRRIIAATHELRRRGHPHGAP
jgi:phospholipase C